MCPGIRAVGSGIISRLLYVSLKIANTNKIMSEIEVSICDVEYQGVKQSLIRIIDFYLYSLRAKKVPRFLLTDIVDIWDTLRCYKIISLQKKEHKVRLNYPAPSAF